MGCNLFTVMARMAASVTKILKLFRPNCGSQQIPTQQPNIKFEGVIARGKGSLSRGLTRNQGIGLNLKFEPLVTVGLLLVMTMVGLVSCNANTSQSTPTEGYRFSDSTAVSAKGTTSTTLRGKGNLPKGSGTVEIDCTELENWIIDFERTGGFAGRSVSMRLSSSGQLIAIDEDLGTKVTTEVLSEELMEIEQSLMEACPFPIESPFMICPDCFLYTLTISVNGDQIHFEASDEALHDTKLGSFIGKLNTLLDQALSDE